MLTLFIGTVLNLLGILALWSSFASSYYMDPALQDVLYVALGLWGLSALGALMCLSSSLRRAGTIMVTIGSLIFFPLGLIAIIGARKTLHRERDDEPHHHTHGRSDLS